MVQTVPCDIVENMSCQCHSSFNGENEQLICNSIDNKIDSSIELTNEGKQLGRRFDSYHLTFFEKHLNVTSKFVNELYKLFPQTPTSMGGKQISTIKITLSFPNFVVLNIDDYAFSELFGEKSYHTTMFTLELTSSGQVNFSPEAFNQLTVDHMYLHSSSLEPYSFEEIFNNTNIGELIIEGLTPRSNSAYKANFNGRIRLAKFTKMVETVSSEEFPDYPVRSMIIEAHESRKINAPSFINYRNLQGLHLIRPKYFFDNRSFYGFQYLPNLESIELDAETIKDNTFQYASRIRFLTLGQNTRYLSQHSLDYLDDLTRFDASKITLDQLYPSSKCVLAQYLYKQQRTNSKMIILPPSAEYCDCIYDFILSVLKQKPDQSYIDLCSNDQQERCQLNECDVVKNYRFPSDSNSNYQQMVPSIDETLNDMSLSVNPNNDTSATIHGLPTYVHRFPSVYDQSETENKQNYMPSSNQDTHNPHSSSSKDNQQNDPNTIITDDYDETKGTAHSIDNSEQTSQITDEERRMAMKNETLKWISLSLVCITILVLILIGLLVWFCVFRRPRRHDKQGFEPIHTNSSNV